MTGDYGIATDGGILSQQNAGKKQLIGTARALYTKKSVFLGSLLD